MPIISNKKKVRRTWRWVKRITFLAVTVTLFGVLYVNHLTRLIEEKFERTLKWEVPSKVYSDATYLYPGLEIDTTDFKAKLDRLGYRDMKTKIEGPGDYLIAKDRVEIWLHDFKYPHEEFAGFPVRLELKGNTIAKIAAPQKGEIAEPLRLEPEVIAPVFSPEMEDRTLVTIKDVPQHLIEAVILIEDERFFRHSGIDPIAILRATLKNIFHMRIVEGGSTLTQQLVKNYFLTHKKSFVRKIKEAILAVILERRHSKKEIIEAYLNEIYLGQRGRSSVMGIGEAARLYFAKDIDQLTIGECALLAGLIKSPSEYSPFKNKERARARKDFVLDKMYDAGLITASELAKASSEEIVTPERTAEVVKAPYFIDLVKNEISSSFPQEVLQSEGLKIFTTLDMDKQLAAEEAVGGNLNSLEEKFAKLLPKDHIGQLQGVLISIQPQTGYIKALVGGRAYGESQFNRVSQARRQPGSAFKPFVYLTAFDPKRSKVVLSPSSFIEDKKFETIAGGEPWSPANYDGKEHGQVTLRTALEHSYNIATARLGMDVGLENVVETAREAGITSELMAVPALSLGAFETTPLEMAAAYTVFPNGGMRAEPISIMSVVTSDGQVVQRRTTTMRRVFDPAPIWLTVDVMKGVLDRGTGAAARAMGFRGIAAGKTGTTSDFRDAWFAGFIPNLLTLVWVGFDDNSPTGMSGARAALPIWTSYMKEIAQDSAEDFVLPSDIVLVKIDPTSGELATKACPEPAFQPFIEGTEPKRSCSKHPAPGILDRILKIKDQKSKIKR